MTYHRNIKGSLLLLFSFLIQNCSGNSQSSGGSSSGTIAQEQDSQCDSIDIANSQSLNLASADTPFTRIAQKYVKKQIDEAIDLIPQTESFSKNKNSEHISFLFAHDGIELCQYAVDVHAINDKNILIGKLPPEFNPQNPLIWNKSDINIDLALQKLDTFGRKKIISEKKCIAFDKGKPLAAWEVNFEIDTLPYSALVAKNLVLEAEQKYFNLVDGEARVYRKQPADSNIIQITTATLKGLSEGGSLCSPYFRTEVPERVTPAFNKSQEFFYETSDKRFNETSVFTYATEHGEWILGLEASEGKWPGNRVHLKLVEDNPKFGYLNNTAVYKPEANGSAPTIHLGFGAGDNLTRLHFDADVVSHEIGHHILFQKLKKTTGESLVLHEGIADFFVFARTGNSCLGELICPEDGNICISTECLRNGDNDIVYLSSNWPSSPHKQSQFISGLLWRLGSKIGLLSTGELLYSSIKYLPRDAGYVDFILALFSSSLEINGNNSDLCTIQDIAIEVGLDEALKGRDVECNTFGTTSSTVL